MSTSAKDFLSAVYRDKGWLEIRILDAKGRFAYFTQSVDKALQDLDKWRPIREANIYFGVCPRKGEGKARLTDILCSYNVWIDVDAKSEDDRKERLAFIQQFPLPPSIVVNSGRGFHVYWLLQKPTKKWVTFNKVIKTFEKMFDADNTGDRARVLRVPDTLNTKDPNNPLPVNIIEDLTDLSRRYTLRDVALASKLIDPELKLRHKIVTGDSRGFDSRSERDWDVVTKLVRVGFSEAAIRSIFAVHKVGDRARDDPRYFDLTLKKAFESRDPLDTPLNLVIKAKSKVDESTAPNDNSSSAEAEDDEDDIEEIDEERDWGFEAGDGDFLYRTDGKEPRMISTFVLDPTRLLKGSNGAEDALMCNVSSRGHSWRNVSFSRNAFTQANAIQRYLKVAAWQWLGSDKDVREYLPYLMDLLAAKGLPHTRAVPSVGRHEDIWVTSDGALSSTEAFDKTTAPKVHLARVGTEVKVEYFFPPKEEQSDLKRQVQELLPKVNAPEAVWPMIGWFFACAYKPPLKTLNVRFPILNIWGTRGSGKTSVVERIFLPLMGYVVPESHECSTTLFVLRTLLGATTSIPIAFLEFRQSAMRSQSYRQFLHLLLQSYDTGQDSRGRPDQTVQHYPLIAPFSVDGEDMVSDSAARERIVVVNLDPVNVKRGTAAYDAFNTLSFLPLRGMAGAYVQFTLAQDVHELWKEATDLFLKAITRSIPNRIQYNYTVATLGLLSYARFMEQEPPTVELLHDALSPSITSLLSPEGRTTLPVDAFVEDIANAVGLFAASGFFFKYYPKTNVLRFHLTTALNWWYTKRRREGKDALEAAAIRQQLKERQKEYVLEARPVAQGGTSKWMHGVSITKAFASGLDIPETLPTETEMTISF